jgi:hypothetical protein
MEDVRQFRGGHRALLIVYILLKRYTPIVELCRARVSMAGHPLSRLDRAAVFEPS